MLRKVLFLLMTLEMVAVAIPMESLNEYNLVLIHGAGSHWGGLDCENGDIKHEKMGFSSDKYQDAYEYYWRGTSGPNTRIGGKLSEGLISDDSTSSATGMIKTLPDWINDKILDGEQKDWFGIYLNRPKMYAFILILNFEIL